MLGFLDKTHGKKEAGPQQGPEPKGFIHENTLAEVEDTDFVYGLSIFWHPPGKQGSGCEAESEGL